MRERDIEKYLREKVKAAGGRAYKFVSPGNSGVPDRIVILPGGRIVFVELKAPGRKPTALQLVQHKHFRALGCDVRIVDSIAQVDGLLQELMGV
ncbi:VRR-NUC domain-containing protein [Paenibacillus melissococcoides]|uniref:VRR-NUC domain-containing protein n=1 Tax=Paenibacillus melissococcoides TaxID=2912268 RepID=A0ABM9G6I5_9BACL|nr:MULTISPECIES: VRR-NUC domain-containing protein [Paenibacillus]MEB9896363.1 VRR-NUC domain-containing protein [Bacillus cereus]QVQ56243.1 nuclease [Paenibacillus phage Pd_22F]CAH8247474.1 VRR-NUC domain-containing protein [Paenibacillus melissococcoides]CAH8705094.1 VRR-NUC domain-containing protein [Paenibacillus melissococcoides]CAH8707877.1 VRR-NUC domain-containing protein [Paenibacillus melissococcoides]